MKNKKVYIALIIIFLGFFFLMIYLFGIDELKRRNQELTILVGKRTVWQYQDKKWFNRSGNTDYKNFDWKKYHVYSNQEYAGDYLLWHDDRWYAFDDNKKAIDLSGEFFAYAGNYDLNFYPFAEEEIEDYSSVYKVLKQYGIPEDSTFSSAYHVLVDFDNDGVDEDFYVISNVFSGEEPDITFALVYMVRDNKISMIYEDVVRNANYYNRCMPYFTSFLDIDRDSSFEFILSCGRYSIAEPLNMLYQYSDNEFKIAISSE